MSCGDRPAFDATANQARALVTIIVGVLSGQEVSLCPCQTVSQSGSLVPHVFIIHGVILSWSFIPSTSARAPSHT